MSGQAGISEVELHAYVDGELDTARLHAVNEALAADPALAQRIAELRAGKLRIKQIYGPLLDRGVPEEWVALARTRPAASRRHLSPPLLAMAAVLLLLIGGASFAAWQLWTRPSGEIVDFALSARQAAATPERVIGIAQESDGRRFGGVISAAVGLPVKVPDMTALGYRLRQIRLYRVSNAGAAELSYRDRENRLFTLYLQHSDGAVRFDQFSRDGLRICVWQDEELGTVMAGDVSTAVMQRLASLAYTGLTTGL